MCWLAMGLPPKAVCRFCFSRLRSCISLLSRELLGVRPRSPFFLGARPPLFVRSGLW